ncbi:triosephosphate isomerase [candidate division WWE3 bacterium]|nr:triosephosphate isomerase [candidate division WWE3 bacterium]
MKKLVVANWKQNKTAEEVKRWFEVFSSEFASDPGVTVVICPSFCHVDLVGRLIKEKGLGHFVFCGSQDVSEFLGGAHTGEVGAFQLGDYCGFSIVGHSERNEEEAVVEAKLRNCLERGIAPILCLKSPADFCSRFNENVILVWEDPGFISREGVYVSAPIERINSEGRKIRRTVVGRTLLYGGSVNENNVGGLNKSDASFDGYLVGNASLNPPSFAAIIKAIVS